MQRSRNSENFNEPNNDLTRPKTKTLLKLILLGDTGVGKTSLMRYFTQGHFIESYKATIGADFSVKSINYDDNEITLQIWDTAGQERFKSLGQAFYKGSDICVLVYNVTDPSSFDSLDKWYNDFIEQSAISRPPSNLSGSESTMVTEDIASDVSEEESQFPFIVVGNMIDRGSKISEDKLYEWMYSKNISMDCFFKTSAKDGISVEKMFEKAAEEGYKRFIENMKNKPIFSPPIIRLDDDEKESCCQLFRNFYF
jgi:Ras-related protein Rab-7A